MLQTIPFRMREGVPLIPLADEPLLLLHYDTSYECFPDQKAKIESQKYKRRFQGTMQQMVEGFQSEHDLGA